MNKLTKYYFAVYEDYHEDKIIGQLSDNIDYLSCEILALPGVITFYASKWQLAWAKAKQLAHEHNCNFLENQCKGYRIIKIKK